MANSRLSGPLGRTDAASPRTPGALGRGDGAHPDAHPFLLGDTPGALGRNDWAVPDQTAVQSSAPMMSYLHPPVASMMSEFPPGWQPVPRCGVGRVKIKHAPKETVELEGINCPGSPKRVFLEKHTAAAYEILRDDARKAGFAEPLFAIVSGYRDDVKQAALFKKALEKYGSVAEARKWVAPPGHSAHATGCAIDFWLGYSCGKPNNELIKKTAAYKWMLANAKAHGFNPYTLEGWHWEYNVGEDY